MSHEFEPKRREAGVPFEPDPQERPRIAAAVREAFVHQLGGFDTVIRYSKQGARRFKKKLPEGDLLLEHVDLEFIRRFADHRHFRASIHINCLSDDKEWFDPYDDEVEFFMNENGELVLDPQTSSRDQTFADWARFVDECEIPARGARSEIDQLREENAKRARKAMYGYAAMAGVGVLLLASFSETGQAVIGGARKTVHEAWGKVFPKEDDTPPAFSEPSPPEFDRPVLREGPAY